VPIEVTVCMDAKGLFLKHKGMHGWNRYIFKRKKRPSSF
jgi:hypothetical protein